MSNNFYNVIENLNINMPYLFPIIMCIASLSIGIVVALGFATLISSTGLVNNIIVTFKVRKCEKVFILFICLGLIMGGIGSYARGFWYIESNIIASALTVLYSLFYGIFIGYVAIGLAEVFDIIPIINNRLGFRGKASRLLIIIALGKMIGSIVYYILPEIKTIW